MVSVVSKRCAHDGCDRQPSFNAPDQTIGAYCATHKLPGMVDVTNKRCAHDGCTRHPNFNAPDQTNGAYCATHKLPGMVDVVSKRCAHDGCNRRPSFNAPDETKGVYCAAHKLHGMVDVMSKRCAHDGCIRNPNFNAPDQTRGAYCATHKLPGMIDVKHNRCAHDGCERLNPSFNAPDETKGVYCAAHKLHGMVDVASKRCAHDGCARHPSFNAPDQTIGAYCVTHKLPGMISVHTRKCQSHSCRELATYGKDEFHRAQFCVDHKADGGVCIADALRCEHTGCMSQYEFVVESETGTGAAAARKVCVAHAPPGYEIALKRMCKYCDIREDVPFVCVTCRQRMHKKEHAVVRHLRRTIDAPFIYDESPGFECTRKRPDIRFETPTHDVIVEVDETQHRGYVESCECARISEIVGAIGGKSVAFVRYNPDAVRYGGTVHSVTAAERIDLLVETVKSELVRVSTRFEVRLIQLWYDAPMAEAKREMDITRLVAV